MSDIAIKLENISKQYRLGTVGTGTLSHDLNRWFAKVRGKEDPTLKIGQANTLSQAGGDYVWALKDINLEVKQGEILGIIGKNGAGKSTLLKLLSQVTGPTTGQIKVKGRIASLLEVGTGFHPELTGRENIFLNGAILGMRKWEIKKKLDEIVDFAGVAKYLDTPVKRYSSGMYVRLAFAVAAHLEPDILVVDEVLAVGDAEFQKKAIGKMQDVSQGGGRTVLFVSHNMSSIQKLCNKAVMLKNGRIEAIGDVKETIENYLSSEKRQEKNKDIKQIKRSEGYGEVVKITDIEIIANKKNTTSLLFGENFSININVEAYKNIKSLDLSIRIDTEANIPVTSLLLSDSQETICVKKGEAFCFSVSITNFHLVPGRYFLVVTLKSGKLAFDRLENVFQFDISNISLNNNQTHNELWGLIQTYPQWKINKI